MEISYHRLNGIAIAKLVSVLFFLSIFLVPSFCYAANLPTGLNNAFSTNVNSPLDAVAVQGGGFDTSVTFEIIVSTIITMVLGLMGVIFLILAIYGGYNWMLARGNEEMVEKSKKTLTNAIIGIIIVLSAYAMVRIIVDVVGGKVFKETPNIQDDYGD